MSRSHFEDRLARLKKPPATGAKRVADKALLDRKIREVRNDESGYRQAREQDEIESQSHLLEYIGIFAFLLLGVAFVNDPEATKRHAIIILPLLMLFTIIVGLRALRRGASDRDMWNLGENIAQIIQFASRFR